MDSCPGLPLLGHYMQGSGALGFVLYIIYPLIISHITDGSNKKSLLAIFIVVLVLPNIAIQVLGKLVNKKKIRGFFPNKIG